MGEFAYRPRAVAPAASSEKSRVTAAQQRLQAPRETEEELTARVSAELRRALRTLAAVALIGLGLGYFLR